MKGCEECERNGHKSHDTSLPRAFICPEASARSRARSRTYNVKWYAENKERHAATGAAWHAKQDPFVMKLKGYINLNNRLNRRDQEVLDARAEAEI